MYVHIHIDSVYKVLIKTIKCIRYELYIYRVYIYKAVK